MFRFCRISNDIVARALYILTTYDCAYSSKASVGHIALYIYIYMQKRHCKMSHDQEDLAEILL